MSMNPEETSEVPGYPGYKVARNGAVYSANRSALFRLTPPVARTYPMVSLRTATSSKKVFVHRLVALAFCPNPEGKPLVNHKDGNPQNPCADNLEWCTAAENSQHAADTGLIKRQARGTQVQQICPETGR